MDSQKITDSEGARKGVNQDLDGLRPAEAAPLRPVPPGFTRCNEDGFHRNSASGDYKCYTLEEALAAGPAPVVKESLTPPALDGELVDSIAKLAVEYDNTMMNGLGKAMAAKTNLEAAKSTLLSRLSTLRAQVAALTGVPNMWLADSRPLLAEIEKLARERDALREALETIADQDGDDTDEIALRCTRIAAEALAPIQPVEGVDRG